jgi:dihydroorotate dehydrogenase (NAD+) catalytic subunit
MAASSDRRAEGKNRIRREPLDTGRLALFWQLVNRTNADRAVVSLALPLWPPGDTLPFAGQRAAGKRPIARSSRSTRSRVSSPPVDLSVSLGRLRLSNPIMVASGTFGYAREMENLVDLARLGAILPKTITPLPRPGNTPWRTVETAAGMLNSIGLDNDGLEAFIEHHLPYLAELHAPTVVSIAGSSLDEFVAMAARLDGLPGAAALELNISCPNVSGGVDFGTDETMCRRVVEGVRAACDLPILAKLTPNVTNIAAIAQAAAAGGADAISAINTCLALGVDWRKRKTLLGAGLGGLSGPAIKPIALRAVYQIAQAVDIPVVGIGGIATLDDVMEFLVAGASAVQIGTANFYNPTGTMEILDRLPAAIAELGAASVSQVVGTLELKPPASRATGTPTRSPKTTA